MKSGVPQGSVLGPLLFLIFVSDLPNTVSSSIKMFADDVSVIGNAVNPAGIQADLDILSTWVQTWAMTFN